MGKYYGPPLYIYENKKVLPRFFVLKNNQVSEEIIDVSYYSPDKIGLSLNLEKPATLVAAINYYPWWRVTVNGSQTSITHYQDTFMAIQLLQGENKITFEYLPPYKI